MPEDSHARRILKLTRPYFRSLSIATFFLLLSSGISLSIPWLIRKPIDLILTKREIPSLATFLGLIMLFVIQALFSFTHNYLSDSVGERLLADLRVKLFAHLETLSPLFYRSSDRGTPFQDDERPGRGSDHGDGDAGQLHPTSIGLNWWCGDYLLHELAADPACPLADSDRGLGRAIDGKTLKSTLHFRAGSTGENNHSDGRDDLRNPDDQVLRPRGL